MLTLADREEISRGLAEGLLLVEIAGNVGRDPSVISREVARHGGREQYRAAFGDEMARRARCRPKLLAVDRCPLVRSRACGLLRRGWSPRSIAGRLVRDHGGDQAGRVSHEAIYQWIYATPVSTLARELIALRSGRAACSRAAQALGSLLDRAGGAGTGRAEPVYIDARPAEVEGRAVPGHWEGDLVIGKGGKTAVATLVERTSRFLILVPLSVRDALTVGPEVIAAVGGLPTTLRRSLTWDCGAEMARHAAITATGLPVYFAHPHSPWERGSNENLNRIVREFFPKGVTITSNPDYLAAAAAEINDRPRRIHDWKKPSEVFTELVETHASTA